ncbi:hypothetical protein D3C71_2055450 [compost metagenome]
MARKVDSANFEPPQLGTLGSFSVERVTMASVPLTPSKRHISPANRKLSPGVSCSKYHSSA